MKILVLGGTKFVGRHIVEEALRRDHDVTVLNRGTYSILDGATSIQGDRLAPGGYDSLKRLSFDVAIDTWSDDASVVKSAVDALRARIKHFIYISSISVYNYHGATPPYNEDTPLHSPEAVKNKYIKDKVGGELRALESHVPTLLIRPGVILGSYEGVGTRGRLPWWLGRMEKGGPTLAPGPKDLALQFIDARDLAVFVVDAVETTLSGAFNLVSGTKHITMSELLETANEVVGGKAKLFWLEGATVEKAGIQPWNELPLWLPSSESHIYSSDGSKASKAGLKIRSAKETIQDTWDWLNKTAAVEEPEIPPGAIRLGLDAQKEAAVLRENFGDVVSE